MVDSGLQTTTNSDWNCQSTITVKNRPVSTVDRLKLTLYFGFGHLLGKVRSRRNTKSFHNLNLIYMFFTQALAFIKEIMDKVKKFTQI